MAPKAARMLSLAAVALSAPGAFASAAAPPAAMGTAEVLRALDTDGSGKIERSEIEAFAKSQGFGPAEVQTELKDMDVNGDGELSVSEISNTLLQPEAPAAAAGVAAPSVVAAPAALPRAAPAVDAFQVATAGTSPAAVGSSFSQDAVESQAQEEAAKTLAEVFAHSAADILARHGQDVQKAAKLEEAAKSLRGQTAELQRTVTQATALAAKQATEAVLHASMDQVNALEDAASKAAQEAATRRSRAKSAMQLALKAQAQMGASVQQLDSEAA